MSWFLTCEATNGLLSEFLDGTLSPWKAFQVRLHLLFCPDCRAILATLRALPLLAAELDDAANEAAEAALEGALARLERGEARPWPASPVPSEARELLEAGPDLPLAILAEAHRAVASARVPLPGPYHLPQAILDRLPPAGQWQWVEGAGGRRRTELLRDPAAGQRLLLAFAPEGARTLAHRHVGSESLLILSGALFDGGRTHTAGAWLHHANGSVHAPEARGGACWCLIREEGGVEAASPLERLKLLASAS